MKQKKKLLLTVPVLLAVCLLLVWLLNSWCIVGGKLYPAKAEVLDLREQSLSIDQYEALREKLPETQIRWRVPFQQGAVENDTQDLTVERLSAEDARLLADYVPGLRTVQAHQCRDYENLRTLAALRPDVTVKYAVTLNETAYANDTREITLDGIMDEELELLQYLPELKTVEVTGGEAEAMRQLQSYCREKKIELIPVLRDQTLAQDSKELTVSALTEQELGLIPLLTDLKTLHISFPEASAEALLTLREQCPGVQITWEQSLCGTVYRSGECPEELDLSDTSLPELAQLEREMSYFPELEQIYLGLCGVDNESLAAFRDRVREDCKVVWMVQCGPRLTARTDDTSFMPLREGLPTFTDEEIYNLRYCEDMICIDIGHMAVSDISFAAFMPDLEYLILAHTRVYIIEPLRNCKKLKFLEVDYTPVCDLSALLECTALEDLNVGFTSVPLDVVKEMTWLKNLWMIRRSGAEEMQEALPDTTIMAVGNASVANGWRRLPNYYAMRDALGMGYMTW